LPDCPPLILPQRAFCCLISEVSNRLLDKPAGRSAAASFRDALRAQVHEHTPRHLADLRRNRRPNLDNRMIFIVGFVVVFILIAIFSRPATRQCRWREDRRRGGTGRKKTYVCAACGAQALTADGKPPRDCRRAGTNPPR